MIRGKNAFLALLWGLACGLALGAWHTHRAALHLLEKNHSLALMGFPALPGTAELEAVIGWQPALAGGIFFALSFGLGLGALFFLWGAVARAIPRAAMGIALAVGGLVALAALLKGEFATALFTALIAGGAGWLGFKMPLKMADAPYLKRLAGVALILLVGLSPWAVGSDSVPTRLRNRVLLGTSLGQAINDYYYKWTLYPAEAIKPIGVRTQPTALILAGVSSTNQEAFCKSVVDFRILCVEGEEAVGDFTLSQTQGGELFLSAGATTVPWPLKSPEANSVWKTFSQRSDTARALRHATALGLRYGLPLALLLFLSITVEGLGALVFRDRANSLTPLFALALSLFLFVGGIGGEEDGLRSKLARGKGSAAEIKSALDSPDRAMKVYGIIAAGKRAREFAPEIRALIDDPVVNVRYKAALAAGGLTDKASREKLLETIRGDDQWYVKDRAYYALWRRGWRPL